MQQFCLSVLFSVPVLAYVGYAMSLDPTARDTGRKMLIGIAIVAACMISGIAFFAH